MNAKALPALVAAGLSAQDIATVTITPDVLRSWADTGAPVTLDSLRAIADIIGYHEAQDGLLSKAQDEAERLRAELAETKRPLDAQMARLNQRVIELTAELAKYKRVHMDFAGIIENHCIAMQSAVIDAEINGPAEGMQWIANTLWGPGLLPDIDAAKALPDPESVGPAQAWFNAKTAETEALRAKVGVAS